MTLLDWFVVIAINGAIVAYGLRLARGTSTAGDWLLAARGLPWWLVGLSMFATAVDSGDYVAVVGGAYTFGLSNLATWWLGLPLGWFLVSFVIFVPVYRSGLFTNAEYLEHRFSPGVRLASALIQIQYRTNVLGNIAVSLYLTFSILAGWPRAAWLLVFAVAAVASVYTATGGLRAVAATDGLQSVFMALAALVLWSTVWSSVGGWQGLETRLAAAGPALPGQMLRMGAQVEPGAPPALTLFGWIASLTAYCVVNQSQAMRLLGARSEWDMKMAATAAGAVTAVVMFFNITLGILGRAVMPDLPQADRIYPEMVLQYLGPGLTGLVVAGVLAGALSTYDSIGSALAALFTRDIYARFFRTNAPDRHYLLVSRLATPAFILLSFAYVPFLQRGMLVFYLRMTSVAVMPLFAVFLMGALTPVHRRSGIVGLCAGIAYGLSSLAGEVWDLGLPFWWTNTWWAYLWSPLVTAAAMIAATAFWGRASREELRGLLWNSPAGEALREGARRPGWLEESRRALGPARKHPFASPPAWHQQPALWAALFLGVIVGLSFGVLW